MDDFIQKSYIESELLSDINVILIYVTHLWLFP